MHIGIDYTAAAWQGAGIGRYTRELVRAIIEQGAAHRYTLFYAAGGIDRDSPYLAELRRLTDAYANVRSAPIPLSPRRLTQVWQRLRAPLPAELFTGPLDLLHAPDFVLPPTRARTLVTIHDLSFMVHPECAQPSMVRYLIDAVPRGLRRADTILADSEATRRDLERLLSIDSARVELVYPGVGQRFRPMAPEEIEPVRRSLGLPDRFVLFVSTIEPRKNLVRLLEAFASLEARGWGLDASAGCSSSGMQLVIAGRRGWMYDDVFDAIERLGLRERVQLLDFVHDKDLPALYNLATAFAYPSIYEGFGFPPLEALACGTPTVTADNSSLPEVVADAAVLVSAEDVGSIASGLARVVADEALRVRLRSAGPERARQFTWQQAARRVLACYERISQS
ncbi:MAG TPA: glycosyltransferase family 1 protein [Roseiflexaceae bacterium]|nr:glycosyltransferase family 1 protein [Roseiflexaceae bacterium]